MKFVVECLSGDVTHHVRRIGEFDTLEESVDAAKRHISDYLASQSSPGMQAQRLFTHYRKFGEIPFIYRYDLGGIVNVTQFNHLQFARTICEVLSCRPLE